MKKSIKKLLGVALALIMVITLVPVTAFGNGENSAPNGVITVGSVVGCAGDTVKLPVKISNNTGVTSVYLKISYNNEYLTLREVADGGILGEYVHSDNYTATPYTLSWENDTSEENYTEDGIIATLTFEINKTAPVGQLNVSVSHNEQIDADGNFVDFSVADGVIDVRDYLTGDVNNDGEVDTKDRMYLSRHLANWVGYKMINEDAADVDGDGKLDTKDRMFLARYLAGWKNYEQFTYVPTVNKLVIDLRDVVEISDTEISYYNSNNRLKTVTLSEDTMEYYNGVLDGRTVADSELSSMNGKIVLKHLDPNTTADYDTVHITASFVFVVDGVRENLSQVKAKFSSSKIKIIHYDETDVNIEATLYGADGKKMDWSELEEDDVLFVEHAKTSEKEYFNAKVADKTIEGKITTLSGYIASFDRNATIGTQTYQVMPSAEGMQILEIGLTGTFYLDDKDRIVYYMEENSTPGSGGIGGGGSSSTPTTVEDESVFILNMKMALDDDGNDVWIVSGYKDYEVVNYEVSYKPEKSIIGTLVMPEFANENKVSGFTEVAKTPCTEVVIKQDGDVVTESLYYGKLTEIDGRSHTVDGKVIETKFTTNVYVFDERQAATGRDFYQIDADGYVDYDEKHGLFIDDGEDSGESYLDVDVYVYYVNGEVKTLLYYIKK